ncbi:MAG: phosphatase [Planctomycetaceae bacterium]|nr:phosphatase [Planctomycetaceae bacterium]
MTKSSNSLSDRNSRRDFFKTAAMSSLAGAAFGGYLERLAADDSQEKIKSSLANLVPAKDASSGLELLLLPEGFRYSTFGWLNDPMSDGFRTPGSHDGMAVIKAEGSTVTLCRNHEVTGSRSFAGESISFDPKAGGGCTNMDFDTANGQWKKAWGSLAGTVRNCAGGPTPWGTWLSCEETTYGPGDKYNDKPLGLSEDHGWIFEVPADAAKEPKPLKDMGRFVHEAVAVDPATGIVYETEDRTTAGLYRFVPNEKGKLAKGGKLQMLKAKGRDDLSKKCKVGKTIDITWVDIEAPELPHSPGTNDSLGVFKQGKKAGGTTFARLEGCWWSNGLVHFVSTSGGDAGAGQVWALSPKEQTITMLFESPSKEVMDAPDNMTVRPGGGIVLCEDGSVKPQRLHGLRANGSIVTLAANNVKLAKKHKGFKGDYRGSEWCGACFSSDGKWLFANIQSPGFTVAITGPWEDLGI